MLSVSGVTRKLGGRPVLRDLSLAVRPGEVLAVIGPNGAGKSTLLHLLSGALSAEGGEVLLDDRPLRRWPLAELARRRAVLAQDSVLGFPFRALEVVLLGRAPHAGRTDRRGDLQAAAGALQETGAAHLADRLYPTLSGGERQRVQLARVLAQIWPGPETGGAGPACYLLLDEPTNNLDIAHQAALMATARRFAQAGCGVLAILHDPNLASLHADRICVLDRGHVAAEGTPQAVLTEAMMRSVFGMAATVLPHPRLGRPVILPV